MDELVVGLLAHVDAGKTTLSEGLLFRGGQLRRQGRVDHGDAFLDTHALERERGITIFSKGAVLPLEGAGVRLHLLDTPGHVDFSSEMERTLAVLDCAVLVIDGADGIQSHTLTLWRLLAQAQIPTLLFVNKMDLPGANRDRVLAQLQRRLDGGCADCTDGPQGAWEQAALCDEALLEEYLAQGALSDEALAALVGRRALLPCFFGSALTLQGLDGLLDGLCRLVPRPRWGTQFGAQVYKIARDAQGTRLAHLKVTGGVLRVKDLVTGPRYTDKVDQIRICSGDRYTAVTEVPAGAVCAVTGLSAAQAGDGLGAQGQGRPPVLEPVLSAQLLLPQGVDPHQMLPRLRELEEEDPQLHIQWQQRTGQIHLQLMGEIQLEVLGRVLWDRFGVAAEFGPGAILYRETLDAPTVGVGHFEPLRHYAEVQLLLEPAPRGSGLRVATVCPEETLAGSWQRLILSHLWECAHPGALTGAPITDLTITLISGRAHPKHTEGGDFRQATHRAVRQGLRRGQSVLLEPWYDLRLTVPGASLGRAMTDLQRMGCKLEPPETEGELALIEGSGPVSALGSYAGAVAAYTRGLGRLHLVPGGYAPCPDPQPVIDAIAYDCDGDTDRPADSVFCDHGAGFVVKWDQVDRHMHLPPYRRQEERPRQEEPAPARPRGPAPTLAQDEELMAIFQRTYGPVKRREMQPPPKPRPQPEDCGEKRTIQPSRMGPEYLLVDGYNIIFAWDELKVVARQDLDSARRMLMDLMCNYQGFCQSHVILVFDAYRVPHSTGEVQQYHGVQVVYTKHAETADTFIEKATYALAKEHRVRVATSDGLEQLIILGHGALRLSARAFRAEVETVSGQISALLRQWSGRGAPSRSLGRALEQALEQEPS